MWSGWRGTELFFLAIWLLHQRERWLLIIIRKYHFIHFIIVIILLYYILFDLTLLNKVVYLVLWYRGDEGEPIYRYSHCDHYSDRHKIDKLTCDIKAGFILSFGILQRFFFYFEQIPAYQRFYSYQQVLNGFVIRSIWPERSDLFGWSQLRHSTDESVNTDSDQKVSHSFESRYMWRVEIHFRFCVFGEN